MIQQTALMLIAGLIFLFSFTPGSEEFYLSNPWLVAFLVAFFTFAPGILAFIFSRIAIRKLSGNYYQQVIQLQRSKFFIFLFGVFALAGFAYEIFYLRLPIIVDRIFGFIKFQNTRALIGIVPLIVAIMLTRLATYDLDQHIRGTSWTRWKFFSINLKFMMFPLFPFLLFLLMGDFIDRSPLSVRIFFIENPAINWLMMIAIILAMYAMAPFLISRIWPAHKLPKGEVRSRIESLAERENIKYRDVLVWDTSGGNIANAAMTGLMPLFRYVFLTDSLLNNFSLDEIETVIAHEFGHIKYKHILAYLIFSFGYLIFYMLLYVQFLPILEKLQVGDTFMALASAFITIFAFYIYFVFIFRFLSRRFELQSDLYATDSTDNPDAFKSSLIKLSEVNYMPERVPRFFEMFRTHPSVYRRIEFLDRALQGDSNATKYRRPIFRLNWAFILVLVAMALLFISGKSDIYPPGEAEYEVGRQYALEGMIDEAIAKFRDAEGIAPKNERIHLALGILYSQKGMIEEAVKEFEKVLEINPKNKSAREWKMKIEKEGNLATE